MEYTPVSVENMITEHLVRTAYMGFMLSQNANEYLRKEIEIDVHHFATLLDTFNKHTKNDYFKVKLKVNDSGDVHLWVLGTPRYMDAKQLSSTIDQLIKLLKDNIQIFFTRDPNNNSIYPTVFDLNTLQPLERVGITTMGNKYLASNRNRYMVDFFYLYNIGQR